jgi:hypothetical protein
LRKYTDEERAAAKVRKAANNKLWREANKVEQQAKRIARYTENREIISRKGRLRYTCTRAEHNAKSRAYYQAHLEEIAVSNKIYREANKEKIKAQSQAYRDSHKEECKAQRARRHKKAQQYEHKKTMLKYGITPEIYLAMFKAQKGVCAICAKPSKSSRRLAVDHDHVSGQVRGLLCGNCNWAVGHLVDSQERIDRIRFYLRKHSQLRLVVG